MKYPLTEGCEGRIDVTRAGCFHSICLHPDSTSRRFYFRNLRFGSGKRRIDDHGDRTRLRKQVADQFETLRRHLGRQQTHASKISSRPAKAPDETAGDWIRTAGENYRDGRGGLLSSLRRDSTAGCNYRNLTTHQLGRQRGQPVVVTFGPAVLDPHILSLNVADFFQV